MFNDGPDRDTLQLADLLELAGSAESLLDCVHELEMLKGRRPLLVEVVNTLMERQQDPMVAAAIEDLIG